MEITFKGSDSKITLEVYLEKDTLRPILRIGYPHDKNDFPKCIDLDLEQVKASIKFLETESNR